MHGKASAQLFFFISQFRTAERGNSVRADKQKDIARKKLLSDVD